MSLVLLHYTNEGISVHPFIRGTGQFTKTNRQHEKNSAKHPAAVEQEIIESIKSAGMRLRLDKVVQWLAEHLKADLSDVVPNGRTIVIPITAPIKLR